ncbi:MAG: hypothetical protein Q8K96_07445 [Rubrivivax sp.]|nr:hypothetical protein [Rubrivivax sp.]
MRPTWLRLAGLGACIGALGSPALAQDVTLEPTPALRCLTPLAEQRGAPEYPLRVFKLGLGGRVKVELEFTTPDKRPAVKVLESEGDESFIDAVKAHVREYRVPCLEGADIPSRLVIDFVFKPDDRRVIWSKPVDPMAAERARTLDCLSHVSGNKTPPYPVWAQRQNVQGRVLARLRFDAPDRPPVAEVFARPAAEGLAEHIKTWAEGYRLPCHQGGPLRANVVFVFVFEGETYGFRDLTLRQFLGAVRGIREQTLTFDFNTMACPFDVKWVYQQPFMPNAVGEVGSSDAARRPFLDWLSRVELDLPKRSLDSVFGDHVTLTVPCVKIAIKPQGVTP